MDLQQDFQKHGELLSKIWPRHNTNIRKRQYDWQAREMKLQVGDHIILFYAS